MHLRHQGKPKLTANNSIRQLAEKKAQKRQIKADQVAAAKAEKKRIAEEKRQAKRAKAEAKRAEKKRLAEEKRQAKKNKTQQ